MNTQELAKAFTDLCAKGELEAAGKKFWSDDIVSREPMTGDMAELKGRKAVEGKNQWWNANHEVHNFKVEGPYVHGDQFVVRFKGEVTPKGQKRMHLDEVGLYTVRNGKIVEESFFMGGANPNRTDRQFHSPRFEGARSEVLSDFCGEQNRLRRKKNAG